MKYFQYIILVSFAFLAYYFYKNDYFLIPSDINYFFIGMSFFFSAAATFSFGLSWYTTLSGFNSKISPFYSIFSHSLSLTSKYIPGKVWTLLGRSMVISEKYEMSIPYISFLSLYNQSIMLWCGIPVAAIALLPFISLSGVIWVAFLWAGITFVLFRYNIIQQIILKCTKKINFKDADSVTMKKNPGFSLICFPAYWLLMSLSFLFILLSFESTDVFVKMFIFPLSGIIGNMLFIFPAGLGIKEGFIVTYLGFFSTPVELAVSIAIIHRVVLVLTDLSLNLAAYSFYLIQRRK